MTVDWFSIFIDNKFCEVPLDRIKQSSTLLLFQVLIERMRTLSVHIDLLEQIKFNFSILGKALNLLSVAWLLIAELIAWKCENTKTCKLKIQQF